MSDPENDQAPEAQEDDSNISSKVTTKPAEAEIRTDVRVPEPDQPDSTEEEGEKGHQEPQEPAGEPSAPQEGGGTQQGL